MASLIDPVKIEEGIGFLMAGRLEEGVTVLELFGVISPPQRAMGGGVIRGMAPNFILL